tara:strand:- start:213 stop:1172 length:960 start_codon:yes stop_codon:yes gene_type:complete
MSEESTSTEHSKADDSSSKQAGDVLYGSEGTKEADPVTDQESEDAKVTEKASEPKDDSTKDQEKASTPKKDSDTFVFDKEKYTEQGISDEATLAILEAKDRDIHKQRITIGKQGHKNRAYTDKLKTLQDELGELQGKTKELSEDELDEMSTSDAIKADREIREAQEKEAKKDHEITTLKNQTVIDEINENGNPLDIEDLVSGLEGFISDDLLRLGGTKEGVKDAVSRFKSDPLGAIHPNVFYTLIQRYQIQTQLDTVLAENKELSESVKKLSSELEGKPQKVIDQLKKVSDSPHAVGATSGGYSSSNNGNRTPGQVLYG